MICVYSPPFQDLVREFYENGWETREKTQELFLAVGNGLTSYAFDYVLSNTPAYSSGKPRMILQIVYPSYPRMPSGQTGDNRT